MLTLSEAPRTARAAKESQKLADRPKLSAESPNMPTAMKSRRPMWRFSGHWVKNSARRTAPSPGPLRRMPRPSGPVCRMSLAKTGSRAAAPLNSTAKRSREIAPSRILWEKIRRTPARSDSAVGLSFEGLAARWGRSMNMAMAEATRAAVTAPYTTSGPAA